MWTSVGYLLFFLMLAFPAAPGLNLYKGCLLACVTFAVVMGGLRGKFAVHYYVLVWTIFFVTVGSVLIVRGLFLVSPGAVPMIGVYVVWPIIYLTLASGVASSKTLVGLERVLVLAALFIPIYAFMYMASVVGLLPGFEYIGSSAFREEQGIGLNDGYIQIATHGLNSMAFLVPFTMAMLVTHHEKEKEGRISRIWLWSSLFLGIGLVLISGRRALQLVTILAPLVILGLRSFQPRSERLLTRKFIIKVASVVLCAVIVLSVVVGVLYQVTLTKIVQEFSLSFDFSPNTASDSAIERRVQYFALLDEWWEHPIAGIGLGMPAYGSNRSDTMPWAYELSYLALLCQTGVLGLLAYAAGIVWIYRSGIRIIKDGGMLGGVMLPVLVGMTCFLIANATNPYVGKFDGIWPIFLPVTIINYWLVKRPGDTESTMMVSAERA